MSHTCIHGSVYPPGGGRVGCTQRCPCGEWCDRHWFDSQCSPRDYCVRRLAERIAKLEAEMEEVTK